MMDHLDQLPPHSIEAEQGVLGCVLLSPDCLGRCLEMFKAGAVVFYDIRHRNIYGALAGMFEAKQAIDVITLHQWLKDRQLLDQVGGLDYIAPLPDKVASSANLEFYANIILEKYTQRRVIQTCAEVCEAITSRPEHAGVILGAFSQTASGLCDEYGNRGDRTRDILNARRFDIAQRPPDLRAVFTLAEVVICTPGNLTAITAAAKAGKSAFLGAAIAAAIVSPLADIDTISLTSRNPLGRALIHFDTEQSPNDHWLLVERALRRAGVEQAPDWLFSYSLAGLSAQEAHRAVEKAIEDADKQCGGVHSILIDGVADLVQDVNDAEECNAFVAHLHNIAIQKDCPIINVIHFNPGGEKTRGHLGSQLERKAETNLALEKDGDVTVVWSTKQRRAPIPKDSGPRFRWDNDSGMHISCGSAPSAKAAAKLEDALCERDDVFGEHATMSYSEIVSGLRTAYPPMSERTAKRRVSLWCQLGIVGKSASNHYFKRDLA